MRIAQVLAGFTLAEADVMRKAVGKKDAELIKKEIGKFIERAIANGIDEKTAKELGEQIETFGRYGFNRSHSVAYALLSYQTAWLKRHYPAEFMAALLSSVVDKTDDVVKYIAECRELGRYIPERSGGIEVLPPDVNESGWKFTPVSDTQIRFGLGAVRGVGEAAVRSILEARGEGGPFRSLFDLANRVDLRAAGKRTLEALILAGACDSLATRLKSGAPHRAQLLAGLDDAVREAQLRAAERESGQASLFDAFDAGPSTEAPELRPEPKLPDVEPWPEAERLAKEKEILGFFISGHPLDKFREEVRLFEHVNTSTLKEHRDQKVELACVVTSVSRQISRRNGNEWGRVTVEDYHGTATVLVFGEAWERCRDLLVQDAAVVIWGSVSGRDRDEDDPPIFLDDVVPLAEIRNTDAVALELLLSANSGDFEAVEAATRALRSSPGEAPLYVCWLPSSAADDSRHGRVATEGADTNGTGHAVTERNGSGRNGNGDRSTSGRRFRSRSITVTPSEALLEELRGLFGVDHVRLVRT